MCLALALVDFNVFWIFEGIVLLNTRLLSAIQLVHFFDTKSIITLLHRMFFWMVYDCTCTIFWPSQISCSIECLMEGWWWYQEINEINVMCIKQAQRHLWSVLTCSDKHSIPCLRIPIVEQIYTDEYKRLRVSCLQQCLPNYALHTQKYKCLPTPGWPLSQDWTLMPCLETIYTAFLKDVHLHLIFLSEHFKCLMIITELHFSSTI